MLRWVNTCRQCKKTSDIFSDAMAFGDLMQCETCHEEMAIVAINGEKIGNMLYRTTECDTQERYMEIKGFKGLTKQGTPKGSKKK